MANVKKTYVVTSPVAFRDQPPGAKFEAGMSAELEAALATGVIVEASSSDEQEAVEQTSPPEQQEAVVQTSSPEQEKE